MFAQLVALAPLMLIAVKLFWSLARILPPPPSCAFDRARVGPFVPSRLRVIGVGSGPVAITVPELIKAISPATGTTPPDQSAAVVKRSVAPFQVLVAICR